MEPTLLNAERSGAFARRLLDVLNDGALAVMISLGHRTGLFDTLRDLPPSTSEEIADAAGLNERYVREWLGAMLAGGIIECDEDAARFSLPPEHAASLTREATPDNIAVFAQYIPLLGTVEDEILECFRRGGGLSYARYKRFNEVMAEDSGQTVVAVLIDHILPLVPGLVDALRYGISVLDVGCGSGRALNRMAREFPHSRFTGYDLLEEAIEAGRTEAERHGLTNVTFEQHDLTVYEWPEQYDFITAFDAIHDQARPDRVLAAIAQALKPNGVFLMQDIAASSHMHENRNHPAGPLLYTISCLHCMPVSLAQGGMGLGAMWGHQTACDMLRAAGFTGIRMRQLPHDFQNSYFIASKQPLASRKNVRVAATAGQSRAVGDEHPLKVGTV
ncbi:MAG: methyltransferase domain-containing protein [Phycisphaerae bacterium]|nr:methyltransferase domain-containing protein [Phycisphaerae bacterium]